MHLDKGDDMRKMRDEKGKAKKKPKEKGIRNLILSIVAMIALIACALGLPRVVFYVEDYYQNRATETAYRNSVDILSSDVSYPADMRTRMNEFAQLSFGDIGISKVEEGISLATFDTIMNAVESQMYMQYFHEISNHAYEDAMKGIIAGDVKKCNRYILYNEDYSEGVVLMFWDIDIFLPSVNSMLNLIVDSETYSIYYVSITSAADEDELVKEVLEEENPANATSLLQEEIANIGQEHLGYYKAYYNVMEAWGENILSSNNQFFYEVILPYPNNSLFFTIHVQKGVGNGLDISMGLPRVHSIVTTLD